MLDKGVVAEAGKHDTLMKKNGLYRKLVDLQTDATNWKLSGLRVSFDNATKLNIKKNNMKVCMVEIVRNEKYNRITQRR